MISNQPSITDENHPSDNSSNIKREIEGYKGSGTKNDPILINDIHDLFGLESKEIGQQGYYFKQTSDIDCTEIKAWPEINFCGHYDGNNYEIKHEPIENLKSLFASVTEKSSLTHVVLNNLSLCKLLKDSEINECSGSVSNYDMNNNKIYFFIEKVENSKLINSSFDSALSFFVEKSEIINCSSQFLFITATAIECNILLCKANICIAINIMQSQISQCQSYTVLIGKTAVESKIDNCLVIFKDFLEIDYLENSKLTTYNYDQESFDEKVEEFFSINQSIGMVVTYLKDSSISNTLVTVYDSNKKNMLPVNPKSCFGIVSACINSEITSSSLGWIEFQEIFLGAILSSTKRLKALMSKAYIAAYIENSSFKNNIVDSRYDNQDGKEYRLIDYIRLNQRYYEFTLGWDFENIWCWDKEANRPALRFGKNYSSLQTVQDDNDRPAQDLLTLQIHQNIWL